MTSRVGAVVPVVTLLVSLLVALPVAGSAAAAAVAGPASDAATRWCTGRHWGPPREVPDLRRQQRVVDRALQKQDHDYAVEQARPTQLGVVALVDGDLDKARAELPGVAHVVSWTGGYLSDFPPRMRMGVVLVRLLGPALHDAERRVRGVPGRVSTGYRPRSGTVVLTWKAPVPVEVQDVAGVRADGAEVRVVARPYSSVDLEDASDTLVRFLAEHHVDWSALGACRSDRGLELWVRHSVDDLPVTQAELDEAAGMRVLVGRGNAVAA